MRKIILLLIALTLLLSIGMCSASDVNSTDVESVADNVTTHSSLKVSANSSSDVLKASSTVQHIDKSKTVMADDLTKYYKSQKPYTAKFFKTNGKALSNTNVKITINKKSYTLKTDSNGNVKLKVSLLPGNYKVTASNPKTGFKLTTNIKILSLIQASDITKVYKNTKAFKAKFLNSAGKPMAHKKVKYKLKGTVNTVKTDKNGYIYVLLKDFKKGKYKIKLYHPKGVKKTNKIRVVTSAKTRLISSDYKFIKSSSKVIKVKLKDQFKYIVPSGYIIKAKLDGKTYKAKTNKDGIAKFKLKSIKTGFHTIKFTFKSKGYYKSSKASYRIYVYPSSKNADFTVESTKTFGYGARTPFQLRLTSGGLPLMKKTITFNVNGKIVNKITDNDGRVSLPIHLKVGEYTISYSIQKDSIVNGKTANTEITVKPRIKTTLSWIGNTTFYQGFKTCQIQLKDSNNNAISQKSITLKINSDTYYATTSSNGVAMFNAVTPPGIYNISYSFEGDNDYKASKNDVQVNSTYKIVNGYGYWLRYEHLEGADYDNLKSLAADGVTDIFLKSNAVSVYGKQYVESWIGNATGLGIRVHFWVSVFKDTTTGIWTSAIVNGKINNDFYTQKINEIKELSKINGISGIHLDYVRFNGNAYNIPGATEAINTFVKKATTAIRKINEELIISCAIISKTDRGNYYYGQDFTFLSQCMDVIMPLVYKGNARQPSSWITSTTKWYVDNSRGAKIWSGLQTYKSDSDLTPLKLGEMNGDARAAINGGADGLVLFRWGLTSYIDFNDLA